MSLIHIYRTTLKTLFSNNDNKNKIVMTTNFGIELIKNSLTAKELLDLQILGIFLLEDNKFFYNPDLNKHEIIFFVENESNCNDIYRALTLCNSFVDIYFYTPVNIEIANRIRIFDVNNIVRTIFSSALSIIPVSDHCAINNKTSILSVIRYKPNKIMAVSEKKNSDYLTQVTSTIDNCVNMCSIYEREDNNNPSLLVCFERSFDTITPVIIPWRYESMLHFHNIKLENHLGHFTDEFFMNNAYELYENVINNIEVEIAKIKPKQTDKKANKNQHKFSAITVLENEKTNKIIKKHSLALIQLSALVREQHIFEKSEQEQNAILRNLTEKEKNAFTSERPEIAETIYSSKPCQGRSDSIIYYNYVPKIRTLVEKYIKENPNMKQYYFYVKDFITYEEVAEIELINKKYLKQNYEIQIYLLSDSILNQWNYLGMTYKNINSNTIFRINKLFILNSNSQLNQTDQTLCSSLESIKQKIKELESYPIISFDENIEKRSKVLSTQISSMLAREYEKIKSTSITNKIEENNKNIEIMKLNNLTTRFKKIEKKEEQYKTSNNENNFFEETNNSHSKNDSKEISDNSVHNVMFQQFEMRDVERTLDNRKNAILNLTEGIHDINKLSLELSLLTEETALKLDSIEVTLLNSEEFIKQGTINLQKADESHSKSMGLQQKITLFLGMVATGVMTGAGFKISKN